MRRCLGRFAAAVKDFEEQYRSSKSGIDRPGRSTTWLQVSLERHSAGSLADVLSYFKQKGVNIEEIGNRSLPYELDTKYQSVYLALDGYVENPAVKEAIEQVRKTVPLLNVMGSWNVPWYPTRPEHLDLLDQRTLAAGAELQDDPENPHPGFHDEEYKSRRRAIAAISYSFRHGQEIPLFEYTQQEHDTWAHIFSKLMAIYPSHACREHNRQLPLFIESGCITPTRVPQLRDVSAFLQQATGFSLRPVSGLLSPRDFFSALAFRVFCSTQYIRHHSQPMYTPEPDIVHEVLGHAALLADPAFADFSQALGMASLGASDETMARLSRCYWFSVEFGLCSQQGGTRAYGAGLLSSFGELQYALTSKAEVRPWDPYDAAKMDYPITKFQPLYYVAKDFVDAKKKLQSFADDQCHPFTVKYHPHSRRILTFPRGWDEMIR